MAFKDDQITYLENDWERVQKRPLMYGGRTGDAGCLHICKELINNSIDECSKEGKNYPGKNIKILFVEADNEITIEDDGRGINPAELENIYTSLNSGSNMTRSQGSTLGENGVGTLLACAMGDLLKVTTYRSGNEKKKLELHFKEGIKIFEHTEDCGHRHGMMNIFRPSEKWLGGGCRIVREDLSRWISNLKYQISPKIKIDYTVISSDGERDEMIIKAVPFAQIIEDNNSNLMSNIIPIDGYAELDEEFANETTKRNFKVNVAFSYVNSDMTPHCVSYCNGAETTENGSHFDGALEAVQRYFQLKTKSSLNSRDADKLDIKWEDVTTKLSFAVNLSTNMMHLFVGQIKNQVVNKQLHKAVQYCVSEALDIYFTKNPKQLEEICGIVKLNAKVRYEANKVRNSVIKDQINKWNQFSMPNYVPCAAKGKAYKELFIVEGNSARATMMGVRHPEYQAIFNIRGMSLNIYNGDLNAHLNPKTGNKEFVDLISVLGCGWGENFQFDKLKFDKIIIATDADVDGYGIRSMLCGFFVKVLPAIVQNGRLFIADPPLYRIVGKDPYVTNKIKYKELCINNYKRYYDIILSDKDLDGNPIKDLGSFYNDTRNYLSNLRQRAEHYEVNCTVLELMMKSIAQQWNGEGDINISRMNIDVSDECPEIYWDPETKILGGVYDFKSMSIELSRSVLSVFKDDINVIKKYGYHLTVIDKITKQKEVLALSNALRFMEKKVMAKILERYKGLGQVDDPTVLRQTIMDPNTRILINVKFGTDVTRDMNIFQNLRGKGEMDLAARKIFIKEFNLERDMIDT
jgi:DNA gyrase subunit B